MNKFQKRFKKLAKLNLKYLKKISKEGRNIYAERGLKDLLGTSYKYVVYGREYFYPKELSPDPDYEKWIKQNEKCDEAAIEDQIERFQHKPVISLITPVYNVNPKWLEKCVKSVKQQFYPKWELCLYDDASRNKFTRRYLRKIKGTDPRIKVVFGRRNQHISGATNEALKMATGEFVALLDNDDELSPDALFENVKLLNKHPKADLIYSDEDKLDTKGQRMLPFFKPDFSLDLLLSLNYVCHLSVFRKTLVDKIGGMRKGYEGSQDFDLILRFMEQTDRSRIFHIPKVLYHWRMIKGSTSLKISHKNYANDSGVKALKDYLKRNKIKGKVVPGETATRYRIERELESTPLVSIIIPFKNKAFLLKKCVKSILEKTTYKNYQLVLVDNNSNEKELRNYLAGLEENSELKESKGLKANERIKILTYDQPFNYSALNNFAVENADGEFLLFLNNDTEVISSRWLEEMLVYAMRPKTGAVGALLLYPDKTIQHAGAVVGLGGLADHVFKGQDPEETYFNLALTVRNYLAVTAACLMIEKKKFYEVGGFNENFTVCGNDVDLGLNLHEKGYWNVYTPHARLYHHESVSRDSQPPECDVSISRERYQPYLNGKDPFYNKNLSLQETDMSFRIDRDKLAEDEEREKVLNQINWVNNFDLATADFENNQRLVEAKENLGQEIKSINWFIPRFDHVLFGGIYTIFRFADYFQKQGIQNRIINYDYPSGSARQLKKIVTKHFPRLEKAEYLIYKGDLAKIPDCDASISTFWTSCYPHFKFNRTKKKFYFIQDYEPLFYAANSNYALTEATYRFGFRGIVNTPGLADYVRREHQMECESFMPGVDKEIYNIKEESLKQKLKKGKTNIVFFGRPGHERNAFELGVAALKKLKEKYKDRVNIFSAGADWNEHDYGVDGIIKNLGRLKSLEEVADLYRKSDIGLVFMFTKHPSYQPFEFMACGCAVVTNFNSANTWLLKDEETALVTEPFPTCIVEKISRLVEDVNLREKLARKGIDLIQKHSWEKECEKIFKFMQK